MGVHDALVSLVETSTAEPIPATELATTSSTASISEAVPVTAAVSLVVPSLQVAV